MNSIAKSATVYLKDYTVPDFFIPEIELDISLSEDEAVVQAKLVVERNDAAAAFPSMILAVIWLLPTLGDAPRARPGLR